MERGLLKRRIHLLARVLVGLVAISLIAYVTLDTIYFHVFFSAESAVVGVIQMLIVMVAMFLLLFIQQREKRMQRENVELHGC